MFRGFEKYRVVYGHLWRTFGQSWQERLSYSLQIAARICRLILLPIAISLIITRLSARDFAGARQAVMLFVVVSLAFGVMTPLIKYIGMLGENQTYRKLTGSYFERLVATDINYFNSNMTGYLTTATRQYVDGCMTLVRNLRDTYMPTVLSIVFPLLVIIWLDRPLGLVALALSAVQGSYLLWASNTVGHFRTKTREIYKANSGRMSDIISNILVVRSSAQEQAYIDMVKDGAVKENVVYKERYTVQAKLIALRECISVIFFLVLLWLVVARMSSGAIHITTAILVVTYTTTILTGIYSLSDNLDEHDDVVDKIIPAFEVIDRQNKITDPAKPTTFDSVKGELQFDNVSFAYQEQDGRSDVFKGFSLHVPHGQKLGVVGLSGAGKSTLTKLLLRFDDVDSGKIMIDGIDIRDIKQVDLRRNISYVPQEPMLFHASIRENVLLAKPDASDKEIEAALKAAHAAHFVGALPTGIDSIVGERGVKLSGGQKQRIAIARAVMQDAPIIVLDEATSALDSESEQIIKESFAQILRGKTAIVVAHRLSTLSEMDRIIVIDGGRIAEDGTHASLLRKDGIYANLWRRQQKNADTVEQVVVEPDAVVETAAVATTL